jgi:amino acid adenylation domain-containing protein
MEPEPLSRALDRLVTRHEVLRTTITAGDTGPVARTLPDARVKLDVLDVAEASAEEQELLAREAVEALAREPFDMASDVLLRALLVRRAEDYHVLALVTHHVASDEGSRGLLVGDLDQLYRAELTGDPDGLTPLALQYADYASWHSERATGPAMERERAYWRAQLAGLSTGLELPADHPRPARPSFRGGREQALLPSGLRDGVKSLARERRATPFMVLVAAFVTLLHRYSQQGDIAVGTPISGRHHPELADLIGPFLNLLVLRVDATDCTFAELVDRVRATAISAYAHQETPFEQLVNDLAPDRDLSRPPLFQAAFTLESSATDEASFAGVPVRIEGVDAGVTKYDLALIMRERPEGLRATLEFSTDIFERSTAQRMLGHLETLLDGAVNAPDTPVSELPLLSSPEIATLLEAARGDASDYPPRCLHELVGERAAVVPDRLAVSGRGARLTYGELDRRSNQLAHHLRALGVTREMLVGVALDRRPDLLVGLLGIMKAGGAYVPLDPGFPAERLDQMLEDSAAEFVVSEASIAARLPPGRRQFVLLDDDRPQIDAMPDSQPAYTEHTPDQLAYVIYTSGSTGRPKGVEISHRALVNFLWSVCRVPGLSDDDVLLALTTVSFDIAGLELYLPLVCGATVEICPAVTAQDPAALAELIDQSGATVVQATPTTWRMLCEDGWPGVEGLKCLCGGEALPPELAGALLERGLELWNMYGPTETTIWSTCSRIERSTAVGLGQPLANTTLYVLDDSLQLVPVGVPGQLHIGGDGLARGYCEQPDLTAERFVADPFEPGKRIYATGDLVRRRGDGSIDFLGRLDQQVKIRGFRVELGDVESQLALHGGVATCVCAVKPDPAGEARLIAYVVPSAEHATTAELRGHLAERLPVYMIPSSFVTLDRLPLTPNGKVDRAALPGPPTGRDVSDRRYRPPSGHLEEQLVAIWEAVLDVRPVGAEDDFFELGGHSLAAVRVAARVRSTLGLDVQLVELFEHPTPAALAEVLSLRLLREEGGDIAALLDEIELVAEAGL